MLDVGGTATVIGMVPFGTKIEMRGMDLLAEKKLQGSMMGSNQFRIDMPQHGRHVPRRAAASSTRWCRPG